MDSDKQPAPSPYYQHSEEGMGEERQRDIEGTTRRMREKQEAIKRDNEFVQEAYRTNQFLEEMLGRDSEHAKKLQQKTESESAGATENSP